nr:Ig-like domain-containing protein [Brenneria salicis]
MNDALIIVKESGEASTVAISSGELNLSAPSIVKLAVSRQDIAAMTRSGNDLIVTLHSGDKVVLKNFYNAVEQAASELVLEEQNGALRWANDPANQLQFESISSIDEIMAGALGAASAGGSALPYILAGVGAMAGVVGVAAASDSDGRTVRDAAGNTSPDTTAPEAPEDLLVAEDGASVSGTAEAGSTVTLSDAAGNVLGSATAGSDGGSIVSLTPALTNGETVTAIASDAAGNVSEPATATAPDITAPEAPVVLLIAEDGASVSGTAEAGSTVTISDTAGNVLGSATTGSDGSFAVSLSPVLINGEVFTAVSSDAAGNVSEPATANAPDTTAPSAPADLLIAKDGASVSGTSEAGSTVTINDAAGTVLGSVTAGSDGSFTVALSPALTNGESVTAVASDAAGNLSQPATANAPDTTAPSAPDDLLVAEDGASVSGTAEAGSTVTISDGSGGSWWQLQLYVPHCAGRWASDIRYRHRCGRECFHRDHRYRAGVGTVGK